MNHIDLHLHSSASDGSDSIPELLRKVQSNGLSAFSVTDHDTIDGALEMQNLVPKGIQYIPGIEFTCITPHGKCHILGYRYDPNCPELQEVLAHGKLLRSRKLTRRLEIMEENFGIRLTEQEMSWLLSQKSPCKPHIANVLVKRGLFPDNKTAISEVLDHCEVPNSRIDAAEAIPAIRKAGGIPVWAHPLGGEGEDLLTEQAFKAQLACLRSAGIQGLECFYSRYSQENIDFLRKAAYENSLLISGGSDYHGKNKKNISIGKLNADCKDIPKEQLTILSAF